MTDAITGSALNLVVGQIESQEPVIEDPGTEDLSGPAVTRLAESLIQEARQELAQAEAKSVWLLSAAFIALGAVISGLISGNWSPGSFKSALAEGFLWLSFISAGAGVYWLALSLMPKVGSDTGKEALRYFGHAAQFGNQDKDRKRIRRELGAALVEQASRPHDLDRLVDRLFDISSIVLRKYQRIRRAIQALGISAVLLGVALALEPLLHG